VDSVSLILIGLAGLVAGGFATMLVDRIPDKTPLSLRSRCPQCEHPLSIADAVPVLSWLRRRSCRHCGAAVTVAYPLVELATAGLFVAAVARYGVEWELLPPLVLIVALVSLSMIDMYVYRLPDRLVFPGLGVSALAIVVAAFGIDRPSAIGRAAVGMATYFLILFIAHLISPRGMGFGDVKLALLLGVHLGWTAGSRYVGWSPVFRLVVWALLLGCLVGVIGGLSVALLRKGGKNVVADPEAEDGQPNRLLGHSFPFGPALAAGTLVVMFFSDTVIGV
jgi:leader peptidase (prepilin peptidase)/N-methyltransferase